MEELCKAIPVSFYLSDIEKPTWRGTLMVGLASGIGFGVSEGITYSGDYYNGFASGLTYLVRFASCVSLHAIWAGIVAMLMYSKQDHLGSATSNYDDDGADPWMFLIDYLLGVMILHGLYDTLLKKDMAVGALLIAALSLGWMAVLFYRGRQVFEPDAE